MKKTLLPLLVILFGCTILSNAQTGNVGIGITKPLAPLHIKNNNEILRLQGTTPFISYYDNNNILKGFIQQFNDNLFIGTPSSNPNGNLQFYLNNTPSMTLKPGGNLSLGNPVFTSALFAMERDGNSLGFNIYPTLAEIRSVNNISLNPTYGTGYVGINTSFPANRLQIGSMGSTNLSTNDFAIGNGINAMAILQSNAYTLIGSTTDIVFRPKNNGAGNVGINVLTPTNKLQIGSVGTSGFAGNDLAIGNNTAAMAIFQTNSSTLIGSTTDIILKPQNNGRGRVGINTNTPRAPLDVAYTASVNDPSAVGYYAYLNSVSGRNGVGEASDNPIPLVSIVTDGRVLSSEFDAYSDARIKNIVGISNTSKDLETINALQITDYTFKDKIKNGNKSYKKVIAQQVEKFYPQVVSKHVDFIPNVYQVTNKMEKTSKGYLLSFTNTHNISANAKKLRILAEGKGMEQFEIVAIVNDKQVLINAVDLNANKVFVYGEEVDDFRTVDYEGLTTLNISATQELSKLVNSQKAAIDAQSIQIKLLTEAIKKLEKSLVVDPIVKAD